jgi:GrpB-like predicted nucleotidyltransferase (UPF0157 family)
MVEAGSEFWLRHLAFRDYLRANENMRNEYEALKKKLSAKEWKDGNEYNVAKTEFIKGIEANFTFF